MEVLLVVVQEQQQPERRTLATPAPPAQTAHSATQKRFVNKRENTPTGQIIKSTFLTLFAFPFLPLPGPPSGDTRHAWTSDGHA